METEKKLATLEEETGANLKLLKNVTNPATFAQVLNRQAPAMQQATPNMTMVPVAPGNIIHSDNVDPDEIEIGMMQNPAWQQLGLSSEAGLLAVQLLLTQLNRKFLVIEPAAPSQPSARWKPRPGGKQRTSRSGPKTIWTRTKGTWKSRTGRRATRQS